MRTSELEDLKMLLEALLERLSKDPEMLVERRLREKAERLIKAIDEEIERNFAKRMTTMRWRLKRKAEGPPMAP